MLNTPSRAATLSIASNSLLILLKMGAGVAMGSISVLAEALHSLFDLVAAIVAFFGIRIASRPPDWEHPFGHGKAKTISAGVEALLIFVAAVFIIYEGVKRALTGARVELVEAGVGVMALSMVVNILVSRHLYRIARRFDSLALEADARHLTADIYTSLGVMGGLVAVRLSGVHLLDPLMALGVAFLIIRAAYDLSRRSLAELLDVRLPQEEEEIIRGCLLEHGKELVGFHQLRTRKAGKVRYIDLHLVLDKGVSLEQAHRMCDHLEADIQARFPQASITIHCEPGEK